MRKYKRIAVTTATPHGAVRPFAGEAANQQKIFNEQQTVLNAQSRTLD